jgi:hypothetical protein
MPRPLRTMETIRCRTCSTAQSCARSPPRSRGTASTEPRRRSRYRTLIRQRSYGRRSRIRLQEGGCRVARASIGRFAGSTDEHHPPGPRAEMLEASSIANSAIHDSCVGNRTTWPLGRPPRRRVRVPRARRANDSRCTHRLSQASPIRRRPASEWRVMLSRRTLRPSHRSFARRGRSSR